MLRVFLGRNFYVVFVLVFALPLYAQKDVGQIQMEAELAETEMYEGPVTLFNEFAQKLMEIVKRKESSGFKTVVIGHALPKNTESSELNGWKKFKKTYEKEFRSVLGLSLVKVKYDLSFSYQGRKNSKGYYISNVSATPVLVETSSLWDLKVEAVSLEPINVGTDSDPVAELGVHITFTVIGRVQGDIAVTDRFTIRGDSPEIEEEIHDFE